MSILLKADRGLTSVPCTLPPCGEWFVRVITPKNRFVFAVYRRHMKTIGYLGQIDKLLGVRATTRNGNTIMVIVRILKGRAEKASAIDVLGSATGERIVQCFYAMPTGKTPKQAS